MNNIIAVDGPSGVGKGTLRMKLGTHFGFETLDTGTFYRAVTFLMLEAGLWMEDSGAACEFAANLKEKYDISELATDVRLRSAEVNANVSLIAKNSEVRRILLDFQVDFAHNYAARGAKGAVLDGRDIGTVIAPDAAAKIFLVATAAERAKRRWLENQQRGLPGEFGEILKNIMERDRIDSTRKDSPTMAADDALVIDTSEMDAEEVFDVAREFCEMKLGTKG